MKFLFFLFLTLISFSSMTEEDSSKSKPVNSSKELKLESDELDKIRRQRFEPRISNKYYRGEHLIYDCRDDHFACVNTESWARCEDLRDFDKSERRRKLRCAPLKIFKTQKECFEEQYKQIHNQKIKIICINKKNL
ncbi:hypothetical protein OAT67_01225 [Bacteriovoracaceae bacterium]|nr:hypothetical protein [Bacteriovoracaceae bacterium]